jgi:hypothetical protein
MKNSLPITRQNSLFDLFNSVFVNDKKMMNKKMIVFSSSVQPIFNSSEQANEMTYKKKQHTHAKQKKENAHKAKAAHKHSFM